MENTIKETTTNGLVAMETVQTVKSANQLKFETLSNFLRKGEAEVYSKAIDEKFRLYDESIDGKLTGLKTVKAVGGSVKLGIRESILLDGIQRIMVRKGLVPFGNRGLKLLSRERNIDGSEYTLSDLQMELMNCGIDSKALSGLMSRYLKAKGLSLALTDLQTLSLFVDLADSQNDTAQNTKMATEADFVKEINVASVYNDSVLAERATIANALKAKGQTA